MSSFGEVRKSILYSMRNDSRIKYLCSKGFQMDFELRTWSQDQIKINLTHDQLMEASDRVFEDTVKDALNRIDQSKFILSADECREVREIMKKIQEDMNRINKILNK